MRAAAIVLLFASACSGADQTEFDLAVTPDLAPPPSVLILGLWQEPGSGYILRFTADGKQELAATAGELDSNPLLTGTWSIDSTGRRLTFTSATGLCTMAPQLETGSYIITVTPTTLHFTAELDACPQRLTIDGETWTRPAADDAGA
ncbi:MAG TPA: hypothetical protein VFF06_11915 [Polyangia bacterium]|nr:hypothetical protein [Polyangia bacterium]